MIAYIKDKKTFKTKHMAAAKYEATLHTIYPQTVSTVTMPGTEDNAVKGDFIYTDRFFGIIDEVETEKKQLTLSCLDMVNLFGRDLLPTTDTAVDGIEAFIKRQIDANYTDVSDEFYRLPYLNVTAKTFTLSDVTADIEDGVWNIKSFIAKARRMYDVFTDFSVDGDILNVTIENRVRPTHNIDLSTSDFEVLEESENIQQVARITAKAEDSGEVTDWYLLDDGSITTNGASTSRVDGAWEVLVVGDAEKVEEEVLNRFKENSHSHLMEFATKREFHFFDYVKIRTRKGRILDSYISAVRKSSNSDRYTYKTGELRVTLEEKLNDQETKTPVIVDSLTSTSTTAAASAASVKRINDKIASSSVIVEQGSNANGSWVKYADGTMVCEKTMTFTNFAITQPAGNIYRDNVFTAFGDFAQPFTGGYKLEKLFAIGSAANVYIIIEPIPKAEGLGFQCIHPVSYTVPTLKVEIKVSGRWK